MKLGRLISVTGIYTLGLMALCVALGLALWLGLHHRGPLPFFLIALTVVLMTGWWAGRELK